MTYCGYVRVSSVGGRSGESFRSPDDQADAIRSFAARMGYDVEVLPPDLDESGGTDRRPNLQVAVEGIESGRWEGVIVYDLSRFFRNTQLEIAYTDRIEAAGGRVLSTTEQLPAGALGTFMRTILSAGNQHYRDQKSEQFVALMEKLVEQGRWRPPRVPIGYVKGEDGVLVPSKDAAKVRRAYKMRVEGASISAIQKKYGWSQDVVRLMLSNPVYLGHVQLGVFVNTAAHKPIIDYRTFAAAQSMKGARPSASKGGSLLAGLIRCAGCGYVMGLTHRPTPRYACKPNKGASPCPAPATISAGVVDDVVDRVARNELSRLDVRERKKNGPSEADLLAALELAERELSAYISAVSAAEVGEIAFRSGARERRAAVERARADLAAATVVTPIAKSGTAVDAWDRWNTHKRNLALRGLLSCVVVLRADRQKVPVLDRVRVYPAGALTDFTPPLPFGDGYDELTLGVLR